MPQVTLRGSRLQSTQERVSDNARKAARHMGPTSRQARKIAAERMADARDWSAPRLDQAGQYIEHEVGPRINDLLHRASEKVEPPRSGGRKRGLAAALLVAGGALGAAGAIATRRNARKSADSDSASAEHLSAVSDNNSGGTEHARIP